MKCDEICQHFKLSFHILKVKRAKSLESFFLSGNNHSHHSFSLFDGERHEEKKNIAYTMLSCIEIIHIVNWYGNGKKWYGDVESEREEKKNTNLFSHFLHSLFSSDTNNTLNYIVCKVTCTHTRPRFFTLCCHIISFVLDIFFCSLYIHIFIPFIFHVIQS